MLLRVHHKTTYRYSAPVTESHNEVRLHPLTDEDQTRLEFQLTLSPPARVFSYEQPGGIVTHFNIHVPHTELVILAESLVQTHRHDPFERLNWVEDDWGFYAREDLRQRFAEYLAPTRVVPFHPELERIAQLTRRQAGVSAASFLYTLTRLLHRLLEYKPGATHVHTTLEQFLANPRGVCQDFAHLMLAVCRREGIPARYVCGYLYGGYETLEIRGQQASHAWIECFMPGERWCGFDPTNSLLVNDYYVKAFVGRDYSDVTPTRGVYRGPAHHELTVEVDVTDAEREADGR